MHRTHRIRETLVIFVGLSEDHHRVLCIEDNGRLSLPSIKLAQGISSDSAAETLKDRYIIDEARYRETAIGYATTSLPHRHGSAAILAYAEVIDNRCWMKCPHTGIWIPYRQLITTEPLPIRRALMTLERKHHLV